MNVASAGGSVLLNSQAVQANNNANNTTKANEARSDQNNGVHQHDNDGDSDDQGRGTNVNTIV